MKRLTRFATALLAAGALASLPPPTPQAKVAPALIGFGCGPEKEVMYAEQEDHFPTCDVIEPIGSLLYALEGDLDK